MESIVLATCVIFFSIIVHGQKKEALIFDRFNRSLFDLPDEISNDIKCGAWAVACPAETSSEKDFIEQYSSTKNALFIREIHDRGGKASEVKKNVCKYNFKLSMTYHTKSSSFRFGFEIYYKLRDADYFHSEDMEEYSTLEEAAAKIASGAYKRKAETAAKNEIKELWLNKNRKMGFTWIELVKFGFEIPKGIVRNVAYNINTNSRWPYPSEKCENYDLGNEVFRNIKLDELYSKETKNIFAGFKLPSTPPCESNKACFVKTLIIPMDQFRFGLTASPQCSNLVTVPLWTNTRRLLKRVDQYLYALYQVQGEPLYVISGISGEHTYPKSKGWGKITMFLDPERTKIPIPKMIYKIIEYRVKDCKLDEKQCWYSCVIVIPNDPFFTSSHKICTDVTSDWGWQGIQIDDVNVKPPDIVYVCPRDKNTMNKLLGSNNYAESPGLKLSNFPFSKDGKRIDPENISPKVYSKYIEFVRKGEDFTLRNKRILELAQMERDNPDDKELLYDAGDVGGQKAG